MQEFQLGDFLRSRYIDAQSPFHIGLNPLFNMSQVIVRADAGGEGGVIFDSSIALLQGLFPKSVSVTSDPPGDGPADVRSAAQE